MSKSIIQLSAQKICFDPHPLKVFEFRLSDVKLGIVSKSFTVEPSYEIYSFMYCHRNSLFLHYAGHGLVLL